LLSAALAVAMMFPGLGAAAGISTDRAAWNAPQAPFRIYGNTFWQRVGKRGSGASAASLVDRSACRRYAAAASQALNARLEQERAAAAH
jgi:hypothetical protein